MWRHGTSMINAEKRVRTGRQVQRWLKSLESLVQASAAQAGACCRRQNQGRCPMLTKWARHAQEAKGSVRSCQPKRKCCEGKEQVRVTFPTHLWELRELPAASRSLKQELAWLPTGSLWCCVSTEAPCWAPVTTEGGWSSFNWKAVTVMGLVLTVDWPWPNQSFTLKKLSV